MPHPAECRRVSSAAPLFLLALVVGACSSGGGSTDPGPTPAVSLTLASSSATVAQGGSASVNASLTRSGGFTGNVDLTVAGVPAGVTGSAAVTSTTGGTISATVTIAVAASTTPGTYNLIVRATGTGVSDTKPFTLTVTAAGSFSLTANPPAVSIPQGGTGTSTVTINRTGGFAGAVSLSVQGSPTGLGAALTPASTTGGSSALALTAAPTLAPATYTLTVRGTSPGQVDQTATVQVTVTTSGGGGSGNVSVTLGCFGPVWFAYQDGNGPWTVVIGNSLGVYQFSVSQSRAGYAFVTSTGPTAAINVIQQSRSELTAGPINYCLGTSNNKLVNGSVAGLGSGDVASLGLGGAGTFKSSDGVLSLVGIAPGPQDLVAFRHSRAVDMGNPGSPDRGLIRRDFNAVNGGTFPVVDLAGAESFAAATAMVTITNPIAGETLTHTMSYRSTADCHSASLYSYGGLGTPAVFPISGIPAGQQRAGDVHQMSVTAIEGTLPNVTGARVALENFGPLANRSMTLPPPLGVPVVTTLAGNYKRLQGVYQVPTAFISTIFLYVSLSPVRTVTVTASSAWLGGTSATLALPDFTGLAGWNPTAWAPATTATGTWTAQATGSNFTGANLCQVDGRIGSADKRGTF